MNGSTSGNPHVFSAKTIRLIDTGRFDYFGRTSTPLHTECVFPPNFEASSSSSFQNLSGNLHKPWEERTSREAE